MDLEIPLLCHEFAQRLVVRSKAGLPRRSSALVRSFILVPDNIANAVGCREKCAEIESELVLGGFVCQTRFSDMSLEFVEKEARLPCLAVASIKGSHYDRLFLPLRRAHRACTALRAASETAALRCVFSHRA
jgi:hypothetical protein